MGNDTENINQEGRKRRGRVGGKEDMADWKKVGF